MVMRTGQLGLLSRFAFFLPLRWIHWRSFQHPRKDIFKAQRTEQDRLIILPFWHLSLSCNGADLDADRLR